MKIHLCLIMVVSFMFGETTAIGGEVVQHPGLQVGGALRIVRVDHQQSADPEIDQSEIMKPIEPHYGESSSLSRVLNADGELLADLDLEESTDTDIFYDLSESMSIAVGYHFVEAEDRRNDLGMSGGADADHESHRFLLRANWRFQ